MQNEIVVTTVTDEAYLLNCYVSVFSIIKVANPNNIYKIFVFTTNVPQRQRKKLESLSSEYVFVKCMDIAKVVRNFDLRETEQFPVSIYYRFFIPLILPNYKKVLYVDTDICVLRDVAELYKTDLEGCVMGVVHDVPCEHLKIHDLKIGNLDCRKTFNSGVLLIDIEAFEREHIREKCMALLLEDYKEIKRKLIYPDNDALNLILYEKCKILNDAWNFQVQYMWKIEEIFKEYQENYKKISQNPYILHYTGKFKPWSDPELPMADVFWRLAKETIIYEEIVFQLLLKAKLLRECIENLRVFIFPYSKIPYGSKIAIYAAGKVGQAFYSLMQNSHYAEVVLWVDEKFEILSKNFPVESPKLLLSKREEYQYLVVAVDNKKIADTILEKLYLHQIPREKIIWEQYRKNDYD